MDAESPPLRSTVDGVFGAMADSPTSGMATPKPTRAAAIGMENLRMPNMVDSISFRATGSGTGSEREFRPREEALGATEGEDDVAGVVGR
jgi:hypothetical protein